MTQAVERMATAMPWMATHSPRVCARVDEAIHRFGEIRAAQAGMEAALAASPMDVMARLLRAELIAAVGSFAAAVPELLQVLGEPPALSDQETAELWTLLAMGRRERGEEEAALAGFREALRLDPHCLGALEQAPFVLHSLGHLREAEAGYARSLEIDPLNADAVRNLCLLLSQSGAVERAKSVYLAYAAAGGEDPEVAINATYLAFHQGWLAEVRPFLERLLKKVPGDPRLWIAHYSVASGVRDYGAALRSASEARKLDPTARLQSSRRHLPSMLYQQALPGR